MGIEEGLVTYLDARAALVALVDTRIYYQIVEQPDDVTSYPAVTYQMVTESNEHNLSPGTSNLATATFQISVWSTDAIECIDIRDAVVDALDGYRGAMGSMTCQCCLKVGERDMSGFSPGMSFGRLFGRSLDFEIDYTEPTPSYA